MGHDLRRLYVGGGVAVSTSPRDVVVQINDRQLLALNKEDGGISIDCMIFDAEGKIVYGIEHNRLLPNNNNLWRVEHSASKLAVYDQHADQVMNVNYLNENAIQITGVFRYAGHTVVVDEDDAVVDGTGHIGANIYGDNMGAAIHIVDRKPVPR
jgi:hypothetical protein